MAMAMHMHIRINSGTYTRVHASGPVDRVSARIICAMICIYSTYMVTTEYKVLNGYVLCIWAHNKPAPMRR